MSQILLDPDLRAKLGGLVEEVELLDDAGNVVARVHPSPRPPSAFTDADVARAFQQTGGRPLAAIWKDLGRS